MDILDIGKRVRILIAKVFSKSQDYSNKEQNLALVEDDLIIKCGEGHLAIKLLQVEGKVPVKAKEFVNGYKTSCFLMIKRIKIIIEYDGSDYVGWQNQKNGKSIQGEIEKALLELFNKKINLSGAGRTDSGVHAKGQVAHFDIDEKNIDIKNFINL